MTQDRIDRRAATVSHADIEHGIRRGRQLRSQAFHQFLSNVTPFTGKRG